MCSSCLSLSPAPTPWPPPASHCCSHPPPFLLLSQQPGINWKAAAGGRPWSSGGRWLALQFHRLFCRATEISSGRMSFSFKASRPLATIRRASLGLPWPSASFSLKKAGRGGAGGWKAGCCYGYRDSLIVLLNLPHSFSQSLGTVNGAGHEACCPWGHWSGKDFPHPQVRCVRRIGTLVTQVRGGRVRARLPDHCRSGLQSKEAQTQLR